MFVFAEKRAVKKKDVKRICDTYNQNILSIYLRFIYKILLLSEKKGQPYSSTTTTAVVFRTKALNMDFGHRQKHIKKKKRQTWIQKQTRARFSCRANADAFGSHTPAKVSTCSSEEPNPPWITGRLGLDYAASENPSQRAAIISIRGDSGPHLLPHSRVEGDSSGPI